MREAGAWPLRPRPRPLRLRPGRASERKGSRRQGEELAFQQGGPGVPWECGTGPGACGAVPTPSPRRSLGVEEVAGKSDLVRLPAPASLPES